MGEATAGTQEEEDGSVEEAPCNPPGHSLLGCMVVLPKFDPVTPVELLFACELADLMVGHPPLPVVIMLCVQCNTMTSVM